MRLLVTGATGFIGSQLVITAREAGHEVVATGAVNNPAESSRADALAWAGARLIVGSLLESEIAGAVPRGCEAVIHLAAAQHEAHEDDEHFRRVNVVATQRLIDAAVACGVRRFVYGSTIGVYGGVADGVLDEDSPTFPDNAYTRTKLEAEERVRSHAGGLESVVMRIAETYGPGDLRLLKLFRAIDRGRFLVIGPGRNHHALVHVDDVVRGLLLGAMQPSAVGETFVLASGDDLTTTEMVACVADAVGRKVPPYRLPIWPFRWAASMGEAVLRPFRLPAPLHRRSLDFFVKSFRFSTGKIVAKLSYAPQWRFNAGACDVASWYRARHLL